MTIEPLFDVSIDTPVRARNPKGDGPILVISYAEMVLISFFAYFILACYIEGFAGSPREEEWCYWAPKAARHWMLKVGFAAFQAPFLPILPLVPYAFLPSVWQRRLPLKLLPFGSPPLLGALGLVVFGNLPEVLFVLLLANLTAGA